jgi:Zn finger protein HypA/HybF involved in hydrogenase expression
MSNQKFIIEYLTKRVCESCWHEEILLKEFQECPRCKSRAYHQVVVIGTVKKEIKL